jgi:RNA polymerase sigma-70 factor (ECF subfamily)
MAIDHAEFVTLLTNAQRRLWTFICTLVVDKADVEDVLQETNLALWKMADQFEPGTDFVAWACRIAHYRVLRQHSAAKRLRVRLAEAVVDTLAAEMLDENRLDSLVAEEDFERRRRALSHCLEELSARHRTMLCQHYQDGLSLGDIGATVGRNRKAIAQLFLRLRATLRSCIRKRTALGAG